MNAGPSYNVAYFPKIYEAAGYPDILSHMRKQGPEYNDPINWLLYQVGLRGIRHYSYRDTSALAFVHTSQLATSPCPLVEACVCVIEVTPGPNGSCRHPADEYYS